MHKVALKWHFYSFRTATSVYLRAVTFGHTTQVCPQVEIFKTCVDLHFVSLVLYRFEQRSDSILAISAIQSFGVRFLLSMPISSFVNWCFYVVCIVSQLVTKVLNMEKRRSVLYTPTACKLFYILLLVMYMLDAESC